VEGLPISQPSSSAAVSVLAASPTSLAGSKTANINVGIVGVCSLFGIVAVGPRLLLTGRFWARVSMGRVEFHQGFFVRCQIYLVGWVVKGLVYFFLMGYGLREMILVLDDT
jgi:hypothetical protein